MGLFGTAHGWGMWAKMLHTYATTMKLGTVIFYLKKIHERYVSRDTPVVFC